MVAIERSRITARRSDDESRIFARIAHLALGDNASATLCAVFVGLPGWTQIADKDTLLMLISNELPLHRA